MSTQRTTRANHRYSPMAASLAVVQHVQLNFRPYEFKQTARRESQPPPSRTEKNRWLSLALKRYPNFSWNHFIPPGELIWELQTSDCTRNAFIHFRNYFSTTSKKLKWNCSGKYVQEAWRHAPSDIKAAWNGIFQVNINTKLAKASGGKQQLSQIPDHIGSHVDYEPIEAWMPVASTSNAYPDFSGSWSSPPTHFGSPLPNHGVLHGRYPPAPLAGAEVPYLPPSLDQEWDPPISSGTLFPTGYSSPASATSPDSTYSGVSYFIGSSSGSVGGSSAVGNGYPPPGFYARHQVAYDHYSQWASTAGTHKKVLNGSWDPLSHQTQPYPSSSSLDFTPKLSMPVSSPLNSTPQLDVVDHGHHAPSQTCSSRGLSHELNTTLLNGSFHEVPLANLVTDGSSSLPYHGQAFEQWNRFNLFEEGSAQTGSIIDHLRRYGSPSYTCSSDISDALASLNTPVELDPTFYAGGIDASPMPHGQWLAYELFPGCLPETVADLGHHPSSNP